MSSSDFMDSLWNDASNIAGSASQAGSLAIDSSITGTNVTAIANQQTAMMSLIMWGAIIYFLVKVLK